MLKILLADDNILTHNQLNELLASIPDVTVAGQAMNGAQAVELALQLSPDLVIMDMEMPVMDGVEATRQLMTQCPGIKVLALSNYDSFTYLRDVLKAGAMDYLLKHELSVSLLTEKLQEIEGMRTRESESAIKEQYFSLIARQSFLASLVSGVKMDPAWSGMMLRQPDFTMENGALCLLQITNFLPICHGSGSRSREELSQSVLSIINSLLATLSGGIAAPLETGRLVLLFPFDHIVSHRRAEQELADRLALIRSNLKRLLNLDLLAASSFFHGSPEQLPQIFSQLERQLDARPFEQTEEVRAEIDILDERALIDGLEQLDLALCREVLQQIFQDAVPQAVEALTNQLLSLLERYLRGRELTDELSLVEQFRRQPAALSGAEARQAVEKLLGEILGKMTFPGFAAASPYTRAAVLEIRRRYGEDLSLPDLADEIGISPTYLSRIFKAETGSSFVGYLTNLRMEKARHLLETTALSVREISERTGFASCNYFIRVFRQQTGLTPAQYQGQFMKNMPE